MERKAFWELFMDTGSPEAYLLYRRSLRSFDKEKESTILPGDEFRLL